VSSDNEIVITLIDTKAHPIRVTDIIRWSPQAVSLYAHSQPLFHPYAAQFDEHNIDGEQFLQLEPWVLQKGLGITDVWTQFKMMLHLRKLSGQDLATKLTEKLLAEQQMLKEQEEKERQQFVRSAYKLLKWNPESQDLK
jgi:hypothetical protein